MLLPRVLTEAEKEQAAVRRLEGALGIIAQDLGWYWHWGDGYGGFVLDSLYTLVEERGYPTDRPRHLQFDDRASKAIISGRLRKQVFERDGYRCVAPGCGSWVDLTCDHIVPESKGGATTLENLQTMCRPCNCRKGAKMPEELETEG